eukprot:CAMPEP_0181038016 /NCGR_PEP_ID=MMETSP1070-20121207/9712_1 /TAXON_ID=265543 /ORGANISM="Minutocellus polymorphus, Strain NH13" /LENGTH=79 /DNA_ID=CAMNT_0023115775 /DNA_START=27 /DNA_END=266 /DNA_ORIENTATION=+
MANDEITYDKQGRMSQEDEQMWTKPSSASPQSTPQKAPAVDRIDHSESARSRSSSLCAPPSPAMKERLPEIKMPRPFAL